MKRGTKFLVKGYDGVARGPFRWTDICGWVAAGNLTPADEVRLPDAAAWSRIESIPELLTPPPSDETNPGLTVFLLPARESKPIGPRAAAYLKVLGCPIQPERLNPRTAVQWIRILEELNPPLVNATEHWAAEEEANGRVPSGTPHDATPAQIETLRAQGVAVPAGLTRRDAQRLISGPPTEGQLRRLKFFGIALPEGAGKDEASELIDQHMRENWDSEQAYQAFKKTAAADAGGGNKPAPVLRLRPAAEPELPELNPPLASLAPTPPAASARRPDNPPARTASLPKLIMICALVGLGIAVVIVALTKKKPGTDVAPPPRAAAPAGADGTSPAAPRAPTVLVLESPDRARAEQLRIFVISLQLTGLIGGPEPRAMIEGRMYRVGDVVDESRHVVVLQIELKKNSVTFGDAAGNIVQRVIE